MIDSDINSTEIVNQDSINLFKDTLTKMLPFFSVCFRVMEFDWDNTEEMKCSVRYVTISTVNALILLKVH